MWSFTHINAVSNCMFFFVFFATKKQTSARMSTASFRTKAEGDQVHLCCFCQLIVIQCLRKDIEQFLQCRIQLLSLLSQNVSGWHCLSVERCAKACDVYVVYLFICISICVKIELFFISWASPSFLKLLLRVIALICSGLLYFLHIHLHRQQSGSHFFM